MIYLHNTSKQETNEFKSVDEIGDQFSKTNGWEVATQSQIDAYKLSQAKTKAEYILEKERKEKQYESVTYNGKTYWATPTAQNNIFGAAFKIFKDILKQKGLVTDAELKAVTSSWSTANRSKVELTGFDIDNMFDETFAKSRELYLEEDEKQIKVKDAVNVSQIEAVLPPGSYTPSMPTNEAPNGAFNTQLEPATGLENNGGNELSKIQS